MPAGVRGRRSQAEKARGDVARSGRKDRKDALQNLEKVEKNSFVLVTEKCCTALCYESAPTIEALLQRGKWISLAIAISFYGGKPGISIESSKLTQVKSREGKHFEHLNVEVVKIVCVCVLCDTHFTPNHFQLHIKIKCASDAQNSPDVPLETCHFLSICARHIGFRIWVPPLTH